MANSEKESKVSLRISTSNLTISEISLILGEQPTESVEKGKLISTRSPTPRFHQETLWFIESGLSSNETFDTHLEKIAEFIETHISVLQELISKGCDIGIYCSFTTFNGQGGLLLSSEVLKKLAMLPIDLMIDLYAIN